MKKADSYQSTWSMLRNSALMMGMAVARKVCNSIMSEDYRKASGGERIDVSGLGSDKRSLVPWRQLERNMGDDFRKTIIGYLGGLRKAGTCF